MPGSKWPLPWEAGQVQSLRARLHSELHLAASMGLQLGIVSDQVVALRAGESVTFTAEQLRGIFPRPGLHPSLPSSFDAADEWVLSGEDDDTLTPA